MVRKSDRKIVERFDHKTDTLMKNHHIASNTRDMMNGPMAYLRLTLRFLCLLYRYLYLAS